MNTIKYDLNGSDTLAKALRRIRSHFPLAFQKLVLLTWSYRSEGIGSYGATDGRNLYLNPEGLAKIEKTSNPVGLLAFLLIHEALHALLNHSLRLRKLRSHDIANQAADYVINAIIERINKRIQKEEGYVPFPFISGILLDDSIAYDSNGKSFSAEEVYQELNKLNLPDLDPPVNGASEEESGESGEGESGEGESGEGESGEGESGEGESGGSGDDESGESGDDESGESGESSTGKAGPANPLTDEEILGGDFVGTGSDDLAEPELEEGETENEVDQEIEIENEQLDIESQANEKQGVGGSSIEFEDVNRKRDGVVDFSDALTDLRRTAYEDGWQKPFNNQIFEAGGLVCRGRGSKNAGDIVFLVDLSGSNYHEAADMISRTQEAFDSVNPETIHLVGFDHQVREHFEITGGERLPTTLKGGGGTNIPLALDWVEENLPHADAVVVLTDGYDFWDRIERAQPSAPVVWLNYGEDKFLRGFGDAYSFGERIDVNYL